MSRSLGATSFSSNFEVKMAAPLDARSKVENIADLINPDSFSNFIYEGMLVVVVHGGEFNSKLVGDHTLWMLTGLDHTNPDNWKLVNFLLPEFTASDNGKVLQIVNGNLMWTELNINPGQPSNLPEITGDAEGKVLKVQEGELVWSEDIQSDIDLPDPTEDDKGEVLTVTDEGTLDWTELKSIDENFIQNLN